MVADIWTLDMNVGNGRFGGLVVSVPATRSHIPGSNLGTGGGPFLSRQCGGLRGGRSCCEYSINKLIKH